MPTAPDQVPARRRIRASVRATPDVGEGTFEALVSDYSQTYDIGWGWKERILPGCFAESIAEHPALPVCWNHDWRAGPVGDGTAQELDLGLIARGQFYLDLDPMVQRVWRSMVAGAVNEWSIAFFPTRIINDEDEPYTDLIERGDLIEVTACFRGANPGTETLDLRGRPVVTVEGDAQAEVARLRKLFSVPEPTRRGTVAIGGGQSIAIGGGSGIVTFTTDGLVAKASGADARARSAAARLREPAEEAPAAAVELEGEGLPAAGGDEGEGAEERDADAVASSALLGRLLATRAGRDAMRAAAAASAHASSGRTSKP